MGKIIGQMTGWGFNSIKELERARNWLVVRGFMVSIDTKNMELRVTGIVNEKWVEDTSGNLVCIE